MSDDAGGRDVERRLLADRDATLRHIGALSADHAGIVAATVGVATDDEHDPEGATIAFERAQTEALLRDARDHLAAVDRALGRLHRGDYGRCTGCGATIRAERLEARPVAETCIACAASGHDRNGTRRLR